MRADIALLSFCESIHRKWLGLDNVWWLPLLVIVKYWIGKFFQLSKIDLGFSKMYRNILDLIQAYCKT